MCIVTDAYARGFSTDCLFRREAKKRYSTSNKPARTLVVFCGYQCPKGTGVFWEQEVQHRRVLPTKLRHGPVQGPRAPIRIKEQRDHGKTVHQALFLGGGSFDGPILTKIN